MAAGESRHLVAVIAAGLLVLAGCGPEVGDGRGEGTLAPAAGTNRSDGSVEPVSTPYTLEIGSDPLCADISIAGEPMGYSCALASVDAKKVAGRSVGEERLDIYLMPADAIDVGLSPPVAFDREGPYLIIQTSRSSSMPVLTYSVENLRISCDLSELFPSCSQQPE